MTLVHASRLDTSPPEYTVEAMLPDMGVGFGYGNSYTGKTMVLGIELCLAIANGVPFFGRESVYGSAAWCLGEGLPDAGVRIKARLIREAHDRQLQAAQIARKDGDAAAQEWLAALPTYSDDRMFVKTTAFQVPFIAANEPPEDLQQAARELGLIEDLRLVVLDTARRFSSLSLSNGTTSNRFMLGMSWLAAQLQCTVLAIAHPVSKGRGEVGLPGDTLFGASDFVWRFQSADDSTPDAPAAMIIAEKVKSGPLFDPIPYELERIKWRQPPTDPETGEDIQGAELLEVKSATVRQRESRQAPVSAMLLPGMTPRRTMRLPQAEPVPPSRPRRRTGILPDTSFRAVVAPAETAVPDPAAGALVAALISGACPESACAALPGASCNPGVRGSGVVMLDREPLIAAHVARMDERITAGTASLDAVLAQFPEGTAPALLAQRADELTGVQA